MNNISYILMGISIVSIITIVALLTIKIYFKPYFTLKSRLKRYQLQDFGDFSSSNNNSAYNIRQIRIQEKLKEIKNNTGKKNRSVGIQQLILLSGIGVDIKHFRIILFICSLSIFLISYFLIHYIPAIIFSVFIYFVGPKLFLHIKIKLRQKEFTKHFTAALDIMVRGARAGLPVGECLVIISREAPNPVNEIFRDLVEGQRLGIAFEDLIERSLIRMPTSEYNFFCIVLLIQQKTGGSLSGTLEGLSRLLRERKKLKDKIKALSSEAKWSAGIIGSLPIFLSLVISIIDGKYLMPLFSTFIGNIMLVAGLLWMLVGIFVMAKMINFEY